MGKINSAAFTGFLLCFVAIIFGIVTNGGITAVLNLIHIPSFIVTFGGALFAVLMTADSFSDFQEGLISFTRAFQKQNVSVYELAEQVGVSDKTVSKWETGRSMPDNAILLDVCLILNISVNELLSGEKFTEENYVNKAEQNMIELVRESEYHKKKGNWTIFGTIFSFIMLVIACLFVILSTVGFESLSWFIDMPSIIIPIGITFFVLFASESLWDFGQAFFIVYGKREYREGR